MLIALLALIAGVLSRKRWITRQPGAFRGAVRIVDGEVPGLDVKWKRGYGRWVKEILVWTKAPFLFRNELVVADSLIAGARPAKQGEVKRLGKHPIVLTVAVEGGARIELASADGPDRALGPFAATSDTETVQPVNSPRSTN